MINFDTRDLEFYLECNNTNLKRFYKWVENERERFKIYNS